MQKNGSNFIKSVTVYDIALIVEIVEKGPKKELHDGEAELFIRFEEFFEFRSRGGVNLDWGEGLKEIVIAVIRN